MMGRSLNDKQMSSRSHGPVIVGKGWKWVELFSNYDGYDGRHVWRNLLHFFGSSCLGLIEGDCEWNMRCLPTRLGERAFLPLHSV